MNLLPAGRMDTCNPWGRSLRERRFIRCRNLYAVRRLGIKTWVTRRDCPPKILNRQATRQRLSEARRHGRTIVFTNACFDILHAGHLACLEGSKRLGDLLVVGLNSDASVRGLKGDSRPVISQENGASLLAGLTCVDVVVLFDEPTPATLIEELEPDVLVKRGDCTPDQIAGADFVRQRGGQVVVLPLVPGLITTAILERRGQR
jgi:D-beta-D-heptose 7-phosphate kinase/D-beta-D-heptose 1-phosphate adenosyltransferase